MCLSSSVSAKGMPQSHPSGPFITPRRTAPNFPWLLRTSPGPSTAESPALCRNIQWFAFYPCLGLIILERLINCPWPCFISKTSFDLEWDVRVIFCTLFGFWLIQFFIIIFFLFAKPVLYTVPLTNSMFPWLHQPLKFLLIIVLRKYGKY